jgi:hypothetical protein
MNPAEIIIKKAEYAKVRRSIRSGDLLSFNPRCVWYKPWSYITWLIALTNKYHICHSAMACWWEGNLLCVQMTSSKDRIVLLSEYVRLWPGKIIVSRPIHMGSCNIHKAIHTMVSITERPYGWIRLILLGWSNTLSGGLLWPNPIDKDDNNSPIPPVCSEAYSRAMRLSGFDAVIERPDSRTEPHHLFESKKMKPLFRLV